MLRGIAIVLIGTAIGGLGFSLMLSDSNRSRASGAGPESFLAAIRSLGQRGSPAAGIEPSIIDRLDAYRSIADSDTAALETELTDLADQPWSPTNELRIDAILTRLADLSPPRAAAIALALDLEPRFLARMYRYWSEVDPDAPLAALDRIGDRQVRRLVALGLVDVTGDSRRNVDRIAAALPAFDRGDFRAEWLERRAMSDPYRALRDALALRNPDEQRASIQKIAEVWAELDPLGALLQADQLRDRRTQASFRSAVSQRWASLDPLGFLAYLQGGAADPEELQGGFQWLAAADPDALLDVAEGFSGNAARNLRLIALYEIAAFDAQAAIARVEAMPMSQDREMMLNQVAMRYAEIDPDAALDWARSLDPPATSILNAVVQSVVRSDAGLAVELIENPPPGVDMQLIASMVGVVGVQDSDQARELADLLLERTDVRSLQTMSNVVSNWMRRDEDGALDWMLQNMARLDARTVGQAAQVMARRDPAEAATYVSQIPPEFRDAWIARVAAPYAAYDPAGAAGWIAQYQGTPVYETAYRQMILQLAQSDANSAAGLLMQASSDVQFGVAAQVAMSMARQDPRAAVNWANRLGDQRARSTAVASAVSVWAAENLAAASAWTVDQPPGESRDRALTSLIPRMIESGDFDADFFAEFSSDDLRNEALTEYIPILARSDSEQAKDIYDSKLVNGAQRQAIEQRMRELGVSF